MTDAPTSTCSSLGSGVAGLSAAVRAAELHGMRVGVLTKGELQQATTRWAQGGVAAVLGGDPDSTDLHLADTLAAGAGLCDVDAVRVLVDEGPARVHELIALGAVFDRDPDGQLAAGPRGRPLAAPRSCTPAARPPAPRSSGRSSTPCGPAAAAVHERTFALDLLVEGGRCRGRRRRRRRRARAREVRAANVLAGHRRRRPAVRRHHQPARGHRRRRGHGASGPASPWPTSSSCSSTRPRCTTRRCRGRCCPRRCAATARSCATRKGERFVDELLPRDKVSRAITARMLEQGVEHLWLDATGLERFAERFPTIAAALAEVGLDPATRLAARSRRPRTTAAAASSPTSTAPRRCPGCGWPARWRATACMGANRLASNSLLDGMVFGPRVVEAIDRGVDGPARHRRDAVRARRAASIGGRPLELAAGRATGAVGRAATTLQRAMTARRRRAALGRVARGRRRRPAPGRSPATTRRRGSCATSPPSAGPLCAAALAREESRGAHTRTDFDATRDDLRLRLVARGWSVASAP